MNILDSYSRYKISWKWNRGPHIEPCLSNKEGRRLLRKGGLFVRNTYNFDCAEETEFWHIIKDVFNGIEEVPSKYRGNVRKSLDKYEIKIVSKEYVIDNCYETHKTASEHYRVKAQAPTLEQFASHLLPLDSSYEFWVCIDKESEQIAGFAINHVIDDMCEYESMKYHPDFLKPVSPSYGLIYRMNEFYLKERGVKYVDDGARSITEHSEIQTFLISKFRFRRAYCNVQMFYRWWLKLVVVLLYPFRKMIKNNYVRAILNMEYIARNSKPVGGVFCRLTISRKPIGGAFSYAA